MARASITLPNGTCVQIEGTTEEVTSLLAFYGKETKTGYQSGSKSKISRNKRSPKPTVEISSNIGEKKCDLAAIVNFVKNSDEAEQIEKQILDRTSQVDRTLLPIYIVHEYIENAFGLSSGEINKVTTDLGVPVSQSHVSDTLSGTAAKYVMGDSVRKKGKLVRYKLSRRGLKYMKIVIGGKSYENES